MDELLRRLRRLPIGFNPPITEADMSWLQDQVGCRLPDDVCWLYEDHDGFRATGILPFRLMSAREVVSIHKDSKALPPVEGAFLQPDWTQYGVLALWTDDNANYAGIHTTAPLTGRVCFLNHEEMLPTPAYRNVRSFLTALLEFQLDERGNRTWVDMRTDYFAPGHDVRSVPAENENDLAVLQSLWKQRTLSTHDESRERLLSLYIMALTPMSRTESLLPFLRDEDMWIQETAADHMGLRRFEPAISELAYVAVHGKHNGRLGAIAALGRIGTQESLKHLLKIMPDVPSGTKNIMAGALKRCGCEIKREKQTWALGLRWRWRVQYRLPGSSEWKELE